MHEHAEHHAPAHAPEPARHATVGSPAASVLRLQQAVGNAAVTRLLRPAIQREVEIGDIETAPAPAGGPAAAESPIPGVRSENGVVTIDGAVVKVNAAMLELNSAMVTTPGVLRGQTVIADSVVAASYTPGAGNVM